MGVMLCVCILFGFIVGLFNFFVFVLCLCCLGVGLLLVCCM